MQASDLDELFDLYKVCRKCDQKLPMSSFHKKKQLKDGLNTICKGCQNKLQSQYRQQNASKTKQYRRSSNLKHNYGMTYREYNLKYEQQNGCCAICEKHQSEIPLALAVDHDHQTGAVRELLCVNCNLGIGNFQDSPDLMKKAIRYLELHKERGRERTRQQQEPE